MQNIEHLLRSVSDELRALALAKSKYAQQLAPNFSIFNYIYTDELMLSRMIADLLNPKGDHAQGHIFLSLFLQQLTNASHYLLLDIQRAKVAIEVLTFRNQTQRRMDIYLEIPYIDSAHSFGICIENKPYAADQPNQLKDYAQELNLAHQDHWHIIYLTQNGREPSTVSVSAATFETWQQHNKCTLLAYPTLSLWLTACAVEAKNNNVSLFLQTFSSFITSQFLGLKDMSEYESIDKIIQQTPEYQNAFMQIYEHGVQIKTQLNKQVSTLRNLFNIDYKKHKVSINFHARNDYAELLSCLFFDLDVKDFKVFIDIYAYPDRYEISLAERTYDLNKTDQLNVLIKQFDHQYQHSVITENNRLLLKTYTSDADHHSIHHYVEKLIEHLIDFHLSEEQGFKSYHFELAHAMHTSENT
ncbi:hypothetical protein D7V64_02260 [Acinetobacter cumulans]|uniref:PD-(D/E)XK nuclease family protein n=1 Tax=Acinetobacter cumulans TaxID=2136182 RepID=A0A3A8GQ51_9GAMM|nr:PD-(D/E)XK nuclease family protein [Acinetobacter cumulans]RKG55163.1 hypothetical protein D7V64_02260 [Acinetobacter cumulans]